MVYKIFNDSINLSGNDSTLNRLSNLLNLEITNDINSDCNLIGIHAYRFGKLINKTNKTYILVLGGTDVYEYLNNDEYFDVIKDAIINAKYIVSFNVFMKYRIIDKFKIDSKKIFIIPQSVPDLGINSSLSIKSTEYNFKRVLNLVSYKKVFIVVGNLRKVKDPEFLLDFFENDKFKHDYAVVFIGNIIQGNYEFNNKNMIHIDGLPRKTIYTIMKQCDGLINSSISEGMSLAILEAMKLKCPVYARNIEGNRAIIEHNYNGFLFYNVKEFSDLVYLNTDNVTQNAYDYVNTYHSTYNEKNKYLKLID